MTIALIKATIGICIILVGWLLVQRRWRSVVGVSDEEDALAGRLGCHGCGCKSPCEDKMKAERGLELDGSPSETLGEFRYNNL